MMQFIQPTSAAPLKTKDEEPLLVPKLGEIWVKNDEDVHRLAGLIVDGLQDVDLIELACIGAACSNQALKGIAVARERLQKAGEDLVVQPYFSSFVDDQQRNRTRMMLRVFVVEL